MAGASHTFQWMRGPEVSMHFGFIFRITKFFNFHDKLPGPDTWTFT